MPRPDFHIVVCTNQRPEGHPKGSCTERGANIVFQRFFDEIEKRDLIGRVVMSGSTCMGPCEHGPTVIVHPGYHWYQGVQEADVPEIVESHIVGGNPVTRLLIPDSLWDS